LCFLHKAKVIGLAKQRTISTLSSDAMHVKDVPVSPGQTGRSPLTMRRPRSREEPRNMPECLLSPCLQTGRSPLTMRRPRSREEPRNMPDCLLSPCLQPREPRLLQDSGYSLHLESASCAYVIEASRILDLAATSPGTAAKTDPACAE
jgi:hypothetical protein